MYIVFAGCLLTGCKKYLDKEPDNRTVVEHTRAGGAVADECLSESKLYSVHRSDVG